MNVIFANSPIAEVFTILLNGFGLLVGSIVCCLDVVQMSFGFGRGKGLRLDIM